jgi:PelA/Pel-15E family pectate lyase
MCIERPIRGTHPVVIGVTMSDGLVKIPCEQNNVRSFVQKGPSGVAGSPFFLSVSRWNRVMNNALSSQPLGTFLLGSCFSLLVTLGPWPTRGDEITVERVAALPAAQQAAWQAYLVRSDLLARRDADALDAELVAEGMSIAVRAPSGRDFKLQAKPGDPWYDSAEAQQLVEVILSYQTPSGGWSKKTGYSAGPRQPGMQWTSQNKPGSSAHYVATFDNRSTTEQLHFLANMWQATQREDCAASFSRGLAYIVAAQFPNGGWPQVYPLEGDYHDNVTFNDDAMTHILELLLGIVQEEPRFAFLSEAERSQAAKAFDLGIECVQRAQVVRDGHLTAWCAQHDPLTLEPTEARALEPASLSGIESSQMLRVLMKVRNPSPALVDSIENGLKWLEETQVTGLRRTKVDGRTSYVRAPDSSEIYWARFYDLETGEPIFPGRDGEVYDTFGEMAAENKLGYDFYSSRPGSVLKNSQKKWRKMLAK